jgi:hypothetical protein
VFSKSHTHNFIEIKLLQNWIFGRLAIDSRLEGARHGRVSALMIAIKAQAVGDYDSSLA